MPNPIRVFISYSHDSEVHRERIRTLAERLRADGVDAWIDQFETAPVEGWPRWTQHQFSMARFVLLACTEGYADRYTRGPGHGSGVGWEANLVCQELYREGGNQRFIPILFEDDRFVPMELQPYMRYRLPDDYPALLRHVTGQPAVQAPPVGAPGRKPPPDSPAPAGEARRAARSPRVFVTYAPADSAAAERVIRRLMSAGLELLPAHAEGESRVDWLSEGLDRADYILLLYSRAAREDPLIERGWKATLVARRDAVLLPVRLEVGVDAPLLLRDRGFDCAASFEDGLERLARFFERERVSPAPLVHGQAAGASLPTREELRKIALRCLDEAAFRAFLDEAGLSPEQLGEGMGQQLVTLLHDGDYEGSMEMFLWFMEQEHGEELMRHLREVRAGT